MASQLLTCQEVGRQILISREQKHEERTVEQRVGIVPPEFLWTDISCPARVCGRSLSEASRQGVGNPETP